jgi:succinate-semialdehyde dehydrogenase/glutarate-semialdehyde dehydrogenase
VTAVLRSVDPATGDEVASYPVLTGAEIDAALADADLPRWPRRAARSRFLNSGLSCLAAKRFVVEEAVADELEDRLVDAVEALVVGNPLDPATQVGPLARADLVDGLDRQVRESVAKGARVLTGGRRVGDRGCFYAPHRARRRAARHAGLRRGDLRAGRRGDPGRRRGGRRPGGQRHPYGLGASVWTGDVERGLRVARQVSGSAAPDPGALLTE